MELVDKIVSWRDKAEKARGLERVEFMMLNEHYFRLLVRELPFLLCRDSKLKGDIILWNEDTQDVQTDGADDRCST